METRRKHENIKSIKKQESKNYSALLKKFAGKLAFLDDLRGKLEYKNKKHPVRTKP